MECQRKGIPLSKVKADLVRYGDMLNGQLVALINKDYSDFVDLSSSVLGVDSTIQNVRDALLKIRGERSNFFFCSFFFFSFNTVFVADLQVAKDTVDTRSALLEGTKSKIIAAEEERRILQTFVDMVESVEDMEALLLLREDPQIFRDEVYVSRIVAHFAEVSYHCAKLAEYPFVESLKPRILVLQQVLESAIQSLFLEAIQQFDSRLLAQCMRVYAALDRLTVPQELFRVHILGPAISDMVTVAALEAGRRTSCDGLPSIFDALIGFTCERVLPFGDASFIQACFDEIVEVFMSRFGTVLFATGIPESFHRNFRISAQFVDNWKQRVLQNDPGNIGRFDASDAAKKWKRGWKLEVYFTLRTQDMIRVLEKALQQQQPELLDTSNNSSSPFVLAGVRECQQMVSKLWQDDCFLPGLEVPSVRFMLQIVARVRSWVLSWEASDVLRQCAGHHDLQALAQQLTTSYVRLAAARVHNAGAVAALEKACQCLGSEMVEVTLPKLSDSVVATLSGECIPVLQFVRKINSVSFRPDSLVPTSAMPDVDAVVAPLKRLFSQCEPWLAAQVRRQWGSSVGAAVLKAYRELTLEVLQQAQATQKFISQRAVSNTATGMLKITTQFSLDAQRLRTLLSEFGTVDAECMREVEDIIARHAVPENNSTTTKSPATNKLA